MIVRLDTHRLETLDQVQEFLAGSQQIDLEPQTRADAYAFVAKTVQRFDYPQQGKADKGLLHRFLARATGLSRAQVTRLLRQHRTTGQITDRRGAPRRPFPRRYTKPTSGCSPSSMRSTARCPARLRASSAPAPSTASATAASSVWPPSPTATCITCDVRRAINGAAGRAARQTRRGCGKWDPSRGAAALPVAVDRGGLPDSTEAGPPRGRRYRPPGVRGAISPTGQRAQTGQHNRDRLGLSELGGHEGPGAQPDPHPASASAPCTTRPHRGRASAGGHGRRRPPWTQRPRPQPSSSASSRTQNKTRCWSRPRRPGSRIDHFHATLDTVSSSRRCRNGWTPTGSRRRPRTTCPQGNPTFAPPTCAVASLPRRQER